MGGHIWGNFGAYQMAAHVNELAVQADSEYVRLTGVTNSVYSEENYAHNIHFVCRANTELGRHEEAKNAADGRSLVHCPLSRATEGPSRASVSWACSSAHDATLDSNSQRKRGTTSPGNEASASGWRVAHWQATRRG